MDFEKEMKQSPEMQALVGKIMQAYSEYGKREKLDRFARLNPLVRKGEVLFAGSSLMEQFPIDEFGMTVDLPCRIYNRGVGGFVIQDLLDAMPLCVYDLAPRAIFLNIGTNDLNEQDCTVEELIRRYEQVLVAIREHLPDTKVTLLAYYPVNPHVSDVPQIQYIIQYMLKYRTNEKIQAANLAVQEMAQRFGIGYLDLNDGLKDADGCLKAEYTLEGIHMYANGYWQVLQALLPALREA